MITLDPQTQRPLRVQRAVYVLITFIILFALNTAWTIDQALNQAYLATYNISNRFIVVATVAIALWVIFILFYSFLTVKIYRGYRWAHLLLYFIFAASVLNILGNIASFSVFDGIRLVVDLLVLFAALILLSKKNVVEWFKACKAYRLEQKNEKKQALYP